MAMVYIILAIVVLAVNWQVVPAVLRQMLRGAVGVNEVGGALIGSTIAWGVKRGVYSNEAGQGTGAMVAAAAKVTHPVKQGLVQAFSVYIDTLLVCTATAMMILACRTYNIIDTVVQTPTGAVVSYLQQNPLAPRAIGTLVGSRTGNMVISVALFFFAFTTIMAYYYYAETNLVYLFNRWRRRVYKKHPEQLDELEKADAVFGDERRRESGRVGAAHLLHHGCLCRLTPEQRIGVDAGRHRSGHHGVDQRCSHPTAVAQGPQESERIRTAEERGQGAAVRPRETEYRRGGVLGNGTLREKKEE